jgi:hypothetical protein
MLKNIAFYYLLIVLPLAAIVIFVRMGQINSEVFFVAILIYALLYHPMISGLRLLSAGKIQRSDFMYNFIPFWNLKYFEFLFFNK